MKTKYNVHLSFEANVDIVADTQEEAESKAFDILRCRSVVDSFGEVDDILVEQNPNVVEECPLENKYGVPHHNYIVAAENNDTGERKNILVDVGDEDDWGNIQRCIPMDCDDWKESVGYGNDADGHSKIVSVKDADEASGRVWNGNSEVMEWYETCVAKYVDNYCQ